MALEMDLTTSNSLRPAPYKHKYITFEKVGRYSINHPSYVCSARIDRYCFIFPSFPAFFLHGRLYYFASERIKIILKKRQAEKVPVRTGHVSETTGPNTAQELWCPEKP
jgi:hypothetical protein